MRPGSSSFLRGSRNSRGSSAGKGSGGRPTSISGRRSSLFQHGHDAHPMFAHPPNSPPSLVHRTYDAASLFDYYAVRGNQEVLRHPKAVDCCLEPPPQAAAPLVLSSPTSGAAPVTAVAPPSAPATTSMDVSGKKGFRLSHPRASSAHRLGTSLLLSGSAPSTQPPAPGHHAAAASAPLPQDSILQLLEEEKDPTTDPASFHTTLFQRLPVEVLRRHSSVIHLLEDEGGSMLVGGGGEGGSGRTTYGVLNTTTLEGLEEATAILHPSLSSAMNGKGRPGSHPGKGAVIIANPRAVFTNTFRPFSSSQSPPSLPPFGSTAVTTLHGGVPSPSRRYGAGGAQDADKIAGGVQGTALLPGSSGGSGYAKGGKKEDEEPPHPTEEEEDGTGSGLGVFSLNHPTRCDHSLYQQCLLTERSFKVPALPPIESPLFPRLHGVVSKEKSGCLAVYQQWMQEEKKRHRTLCRAAQATLPPSELYYEALYRPAEEEVKQHLQQKLWESELMDARISEQFALHLYHQPPASTSSNKSNIANGGVNPNSVGGTQSSATIPSGTGSQSTGVPLTMGPGVAIGSAGRMSVSGGGLSSSRRNAPAGSLPSVSAAGGGPPASYSSLGTSPHYHPSSTIRGGGWGKSSPGSMASSYAGVMPGESVLHYTSANHSGAATMGPTSPKSAALLPRGVVAPGGGGGSFYSSGAFPVLPGATRYVDILQYTSQARAQRNLVLDNLLDAFVGGYYIMHPDAKAKKEAADEAEARRRASLAAAALLKEGENGEGARERKSGSMSQRSSITKAKNNAEKGNAKRGKKKKAALDRQERTPRDGEPSPNLRLFQHALMGEADAQGLLTLSQLQKALHDVPFEVTNSEALRIFFLWIRETSGAPLLHRPPPAGTGVNTAVGGEDGGAFPPGGAGSGAAMSFPYLTRHGTANIEPLQFSLSGGGRGYPTETAAGGMGSARRGHHGSGAGQGVASAGPAAGSSMNAITGGVPLPTNFSSSTSSPASMSTGAASGATTGNTPHAGGDPLTRTLRDTAGSAIAHSAPNGNGATIPGTAGGAAFGAGSSGSTCNANSGSVSSSSGQAGGQGLPPRRRSTSMHARRASSICPSKTESPPQRGPGYPGASAPPAMPMPYLPSTAVVYVHEVLAAIDELLHSEGTRDMVRWLCFQLFAQEGQGYIHKSILQHIRHTKEGESDRASGNITGSTIKSLFDCFDEVEKQEEEAYIKSTGKGKKRRKAPPPLPSHQKSAIPLHVMRKVHISFLEFVHFFDTLPQLPAAFMHYWLPLLVCTPSAPFLMTPLMAAMGVYNGVASRGSSSLCGLPSGGPGEAGEKRMSMGQSNAFSGIQRRGRGNSMTTFKDGHPANAVLSHRRPSEAVLVGSGGGEDEDGTLPLSVHGGGEAGEHPSGVAVNGSSTVQPAPTPRDRAPSIATTTGSGVGGGGWSAGLVEDNFFSSGGGMHIHPPSFPPRPSSIEEGTYPLELLGPDEPTRTLLVHQLIVYRVDAVKNGLLLMRQPAPSPTGAASTKGKVAPNEETSIGEKEEGEEEEGTAGK